MDTFEKIYFTLFIITLILFIIGFCMSVICISDTRTSHKFIAWILMSPFLAIGTVSAVYVIFIELILDCIWGMDIHLPLSFLQ